MSEEFSTPNSSQQDRESLVVTLLKGFVRLILVIAAGATIGAIAYLAYLFIFRDIIRQPSSEFQEAFSISETRQALAQDRVDEKLSQYNERIAILESQRVLDAEALDELQNDMAILQTTIEDQSALLERISALEDSAKELFDQQVQMDQQITGSQTDIEGIVATIEAQSQASDQISPETLLQEVRLLHTLELLDRSRLFLLQNNLGMAEQDVLQARDILLALSEDASADQQTILANWVDRLEGIADALPQTPRLASIDLEIVWNMMILGLDKDLMAVTLIPLDLATPEAQSLETPIEPAASITPTP